MNQSELEGVPDSPGIFCVWCSVPLTEAGAFIKKTCLKCYRLLLNAGLSDKEILNPELSRKKESTPKVRLKI